MVLNLLTPEWLKKKIVCVCVCARTCVHMHACLQKKREWAHKQIINQRGKNSNNRWIW